MLANQLPAPVFSLLSVHFGNPAGRTRATVIVSDSFQAMHDLRDHLLHTNLAGTYHFRIQENGQTIPTHKYSAYLSR